jgi:hypothetical protein
VNPASIAALREHGGDPATAALTHQGRRWLGRALAPSCDHCADRNNCEAYTAGGTCALAEQEQADLYAAVTALPHIRPEQAPLVRAYCRDAVFVEIVARYLGATSPFLPGADAAAYIEGQPILKGYSAAVARMTKTADALGLTPAARSRLGLDAEGRPQGIGRLLSAAWEPVENAEEGSAHADD